MTNPASDPRSLIEKARAQHATIQVHINTFNWDRGDKGFAEPVEFGFTVFEQLRLVSALADLCERLLARVEELEKVNQRLTAKCVWFDDFYGSPDEDNHDE